MSGSSGSEVDVEQAPQGQTWKQELDHAPISEFRAESRIATARFSSAYILGPSTLGGQVH